MSKTILPLLIVILATVSLFAQSTAPNYEFRNGNWFNGSAFVPATWYSVGGTLSKKTPAKIDSIVDLAGRWVVPPLGDAFCASVADNPSAGQQLNFYMEEGVFYLQILGNTQEGRRVVEPQMGKPGTPDGLLANGAITCTMGYPFLKYEAPAQGVRNPQAMADKYTELKEGRKMLGDGYWFIDTKADLDKYWDKIKAGHPGLLSIYLLDAANGGGKETKGLTPDAAKAVIKKAHKAKLRVYAHVETAEDLRLGLKLGVDGFANLPGSNWDGSGDAQRYELRDEDWKKLAKKKTPVIPLFSHAQTVTPRAGAQAAQAKMMKQMLDNGVNVVIGSDDPQRTIRSEINYWFQFGDLNYSQMIQILCTNTPQAIFPNRKIGRFEDGYEASFLVLSDNPLQNVLKIRAIAYKVKNGVIIRE